MTPEAAPGDLALRLDWRPDDGGLDGLVEARNLADGPVRLSGKPEVVPLEADGTPLDAPTIVTMELRLPGYVELAPGESARCGVSWAGWDGPPCGGSFLVRWGGGESVVTATGPHQPSSRGPVTNLSSTWWESLAGPGPQNMTVAKVAVCRNPTCS